MHNIFEQNTKIGLLAGMIGGMYKYILMQVQTQGFGESLLKAAFTALICGIAGVAGKEVYSFFKGRILKKKKQ